MRCSSADTDAEQAHLRLLEPSASLQQRQLKVCHVAFLGCVPSGPKRRQGEAELLDLRTAVERRRFGAPRGASEVAGGFVAWQHAGLPVDDVNDERALR
jgi:hypothetical protein